MGIMLAGALFHCQFQLVVGQECLWFDVGQAVLSFDMPAKAQQDKAAWQWVQDVQDPSDVSLTHVKAAYHCDLKPCSRGQCRSVHTRFCCSQCINSPEGH